LLVCVSTQLAPHKALPGEQPACFGLQSPCSQSSLSRHFLSQAPQLRGSLFGSTHAPPQSAWLSAQPQVPALQKTFAEQARPQAPQLSGSESTPTHSLPHAVRPSGQLCTQTPETHD
jgi:hypothetical protein